MNKYPIILFLILLSSCTPNKNDAHEKSATTSTSTVPFKKLPYDFEKYYFDSISKSIIPNKAYQYWGYVAYNSPLKKKFTLLKKGGDTLLRPRIDSMPATSGFFHGGHPNFRSNFAVVIENDSLKYISTATGFREFAGTIDNLDEAVLVAMSFGYHPYDDTEYRIVNGNYEFRMRRVYNRLTSSPYLNIITVTKDGFVKITADNNSKTLK